jgi:hypothetical protein
VRYGGEPGSAPLQLRAAVTNGTIVTELADARPHAADAPADDYGLRLLEALAARWAVEQGHGTLAWFELKVRAS